MTIRTFHHNFTKKTSLVDSEDETPKVGRPALEKARKWKGKNKSKKQKPYKSDSESDEVAQTPSKLYELEVIEHIEQTPKFIQEENSLKPPKRRSLSTIMANIAEFSQQNVSLTRGMRTSSAFLHLELKQDSPSINQTPQATPSSSESVPFKDGVAIQTVDGTKITIHNCVDFLAKLFPLYSEEEIKIASENAFFVVSYPDAIQIYKPVWFLKHIRNDDIFGNETGQDDDRKE